MDGRGELAALLGDPHIRLALLMLAIANLAMVGVMAVAPVHLQHHGAAMGTIGLMISAHIGAMYLPSPLTGWLADRFGARMVAGLGALLLLTAGGFGLLGLVAAAPCLLVVVVLATGGRRQAGVRLAVREPQGGDGRRNVA